MQKMTIAQAAEFFEVSKEAIHNRVRRGSLESEVVDGEKHVFIDENKSKTSPKSPKKTRAKSAPKNSSVKVDDRYYNLLKEQNTQLQEKVEKLEGETRSLRDQKEKMLIDERLKIEQIYKDKDEQLKNILNAISSKFILNPPEASDIDADIIEPSTKENVDEENFSKNEQYQASVDELSILTSLKKYLKARDFSKKKRKKIKAKFERNADEDERVVKLNKKIYIDLGKYSYSDYSL